MHQIKTHYKYKSLSYFKSYNIDKLKTDEFIKDFH